MVTTSPSLTSFLVISSSLCKVALEIITPPTLTGCSFATGVNAPVLVVFGALYHWFPLMTGRMLNEGLGKLHFWITFIGAYAIYFPMHYQGLQGVPRRYYEMYDSTYASSAFPPHLFLYLF